MRPTSCGRYQIVSELGRGGMGVVYRARDEESGQEVALKITQQRMDARRLARFRREGEITASLHHVGIVRIHSTGEVEGRPYLAYELVQGQSLDQILDGVELRRRVELIRDAARALGHAHDQGVVHRDVKGENILVDEQGHVRVADFGLATAADLERLTQTGVMLGTPSYMSPEQVEGRAGNASPASDVWSLGILLYRALTGELPFAAGTLVELVGLITTTRATPPRRLKADAPVALESICLRALSRRPEERHADGNVLADELDDWLTGHWRAPPRGVRWSAVAVPLSLVGLGVLLASQRTRGPEPEATSTNAQPASLAKPKALRLSEALLRTKRRELVKIEGLHDPRLRRQQLRRWLQANGRLPLEELAACEELLRRAELELPLLELSHEAISASTDEGELILEHRFRPNGRATKAYFLDDEHLLTQGANFRLCCWRLSAPEEPLWTVRAGPPQACGLAVHPNGKTVVFSRITGSDSPTIYALDLPSLEPRSLPAPSTGQFVRLAFSPDGEILALGNSAHGVYLYRWPSLELLQQLPALDLRDMKFSKDGAHLAAAGGGRLDVGRGASQRRNHWLKVWRVASGQAEHELGMHTAQTAVDFVGGDQALIAGDEAGHLLIIELGDPDQRHPLLGEQVDGLAGDIMSKRAHSGEVSGIWVHPDGLHAFSINSIPDNGVGAPELRVWDLERREQVRWSEAGRSALISLYPSPDATRLAIGTGFLEAQVWRAEPR